MLLWLSFGCRQFECLRRGFQSLATTRIRRIKRTDDRMKKGGATFVLYIQFLLRTSRWWKETWTFLWNFRLAYRRIKNGLHLSLRSEKTKIDAAIELASVVPNANENSSSTILVWYSVVSIESNANFRLTFIQLSSIRLPKQRSSDVGVQTANIRESNKITAICNELVICARHSTWMSNEGS